MTSQQLNNHPQNLKARVATLEEELSKMKQLLLANLLQRKQPWWVDIVGSFKDDPTFEEATQLGQDWRQSADLTISLHHSDGRNSFEKCRVLAHKYTRLQK